LNWSVAQVDAPVAITYSGLDLRCKAQLGSNIPDSNISSLRHHLEQAIEHVTISYASMNAVQLDRHATPCLLFCRAVALGLRKSNEEANDGAAGQVGNEVGEFAKFQAFNF
jgi:hypothetical protein